jgi:hypothetical protein
LFNIEAFKQNINKMMLKNYFLLFHLIMICFAQNNTKTNLNQIVNASKKFLPTDQNFNKSTTKLIINETKHEQTNKRNTLHGQPVQINYENENQLVTISHWILGLLVAIIVIFVVCIVIVVIILIVNNCFRK